MNSLGTENSVDLFPPAIWASHPAALYAGADYPGLRPIGSWRLDPDGELRGLDPDALGWRDRDADEPVDLSDRQFVLAYGSNADPHKLLTKEGFLGDDSVFALRAAIFGWAAVCAMHAEATTRWSRPWRLPPAGWRCTRSWLSRQISCA